MKYKNRLNFSGIKFIWFLGIEIAVVVGGVIYISVIADSMGLAILVLIISTIIAGIMSMIGLFFAFVTRVKWLYFILHAVLVYPIVSSWIEMIQEEDWLQGLVDFFVLAPLLGGLLISLPVFLLINKKKPLDIETTIKKEEAS